MLKRVGFILAALLLILPAAALADGVDFGFSGGSIDASGTTSAGLALTTQYGTGSSSLLDYIARIPGGVPSATGNLGSVDFTTGQVTGQVGTDVYFGAGGTFIVLANAAFQAATGSGPVLFVGTFVDASTVPNYPSNFPTGPAGTAAVWSSTIPCPAGLPVTSGNVCSRIYGTIQGWIDPGFLAWLGIPNAGVSSAQGWFATLDLQYSPTSTTLNIIVGDAQLVVPEPATLTLLGTGLLGIAGLLRRKVRSS